ncbi:MAG: hypothetical protein N2B06_00505 [Clostridium sp.]
MDFYNIPHINAVEYINTITNEHKYPQGYGSYVKYCDEFTTSFNLSGIKNGFSYMHDCDTLYDIEIDGEPSDEYYIILNDGLPDQELIKFKSFTDEDPIILTSGEINTIGIISNNNNKKKITFTKCWYSSDIRRELSIIETNFK